METAYFAAGCFWGPESTFRKIPGVSEASVGYMGGRTENPTYEDVCTGATGHAEAVEVRYDPAVVSYEQLLEAFFKMHDPTQINRQGPDRGTQYRSAVFYADQAQAGAVEFAKARLEDARVFPRPIATEIAAAGTFWRAEDYHQQYFAKRGMAAHGD